ncbi:MAG: hypothetical protein EZS28_027532 [Streblomastix strix]|uniref:Uncharacterized protein n=1 Tax=Streblomastix strix TaxID=222440 RepID=A0A5J4V4A0_9EUKA|nr:MAG: hypothetical protein EZS28_027532 [Streblomastix strix]
MTISEAAKQGVLVEFLNRLQKNDQVKYHNNPQNPIFQMENIRFFNQIMNKHYGIPKQDFVDGNRIQDNDMIVQLHNVLYRLIVESINRKETKYTLAKNNELPVFEKQEIERASEIVSNSRTAVQVPEITSEKDRRADNKINEAPDEEDGNSSKNEKVEKQESKEVERKEDKENPECCPTWVIILIVVLIYLLLKSGNKKK